MTSIKQFLVPGLFLSIIILGTIATLLVVSQEALNMAFEVDLVVTSQTTLWDPGYHEFEVQGSGWLDSVYNRTFTITGNGTANYTVAYGPPGPFWADILFTGEMKDHAKHNGPIVIDGIYTGVTMLDAPSPGFARTESVNGASGFGNLSLPIHPDNWIGPIPDGFNVTADLVIVDFSSIGDGRSFTIKASGSFTVIPLFSEPPVIPEFSFLAIPIFTGTLVFITYRRRH